MKILRSALKRPEAVSVNGRSAFEVVLVWRDPKTGEEAEEKYPGLTEEKARILYEHYAGNMLARRRA